MSNLPREMDTERSDREETLSPEMVVAELELRARGEKSAVSEEAMRRTARARNTRARERFREWLADESGYDESTWPELKKALDENRNTASARKLFCD